MSQYIWPIEKNLYDVKWGRGGSALRMNLGEGTIQPITGTDCNPHLRAKETEAQRRESTCPRSHILKVVITNPDLYWHRA